jgi:hypothetical protein
MNSLIKFAEGEAYCPCCTGVYECDPECTIREDAERLGGEAWIRYERMLAARAALEGMNG